MRNTFGACLLLLAMASAWGQSPSLKPGDAAPPISVAKFFNGSAPNLRDGKVHVVEFWATWCGPCKANIPHLAALQRKYQEQIVVLGVSVWEKAADQVQQAEDFYRSKRSVMTYTVAADDNGA